MSKALLDWSDASLQKFIDEAMLQKWPGPLNEIKELLIEFALRIREIRKLAKTGYEVHNGVRWVRADDLLMVLDQ